MRVCKSQFFVRVRVEFFSEVAMAVKKKVPDDIEAQVERIAVIDCETDPFAKGRTVIRPFIWGYYNGAEYREFRETHTLVEFLCERDEIVYAHNGVSTAAYSDR